MMGPTHAVWGAAAGLVSSHILSPSPLPETLLLAVGVGLVGGLLPDIDHPPAMAAHPGQQVKKLAYGLTGVKRHSLVAFILAPLFWLTDLPVQALSHLFAARLGHRGIMHSLGAGLIWAALVGGLAMLIWGASSWPVWIFLFAGYSSHLLTDGLTISPQPIFFPLAWEADEVRTVGGKRQKRKRTVRLVPLLPTKLHLLPPPLRMAASSGVANTLVSAIGILIIGMVLAGQLKSIYLPFLQR